MPENRQIIIETLCTLLKDATDTKIRIRAAESLGRLKAETAVLQLCQIATTDPDTSVRLAAIDALVAIAQPQRLNPMPETPKNQPTFNIQSVGNINTGDMTIQGDQIGIQQNYTTDPEIQATIADLKALITDLQTQHSTVTTTAQALEIIDAEFTEIKRTPTHKLATLRKQILNPERHLQAIKATAAEVTKHYLEESVWAKASITYLDKLSETPDQGA
jgi:hypothetical protein